jgi:hypothetical protein
MYNTDTELMFPPRIIPLLRDIRGVVWRNFIDQFSSGTTDVEDRAAFTLMMVRLGGCQACSIDSFRGMRGCTACASQTIRRYRGSDDDLLTQFQQARTEIIAYRQKLSKARPKIAVERAQQNGNV